MTRRGLTSGHRLFVAFLLTILGPGMVLAFLGARGLWGERQSVNQRLQERLEHSAALAARSLEEQIARLLQPDDNSHAVVDWPDDGSWVLVSRKAGRLRVLPDRALPYDLEPVDRLVIDSSLSEVETADSEARRLKASGHIDEAVKRWRHISSRGGSIGPLPADLVAGFELARIDAADAASFRQRLMSGQWRIDKARFEYYAGDILGHGTLSEAESARLGLAEAVEAGLRGEHVLQTDAGVHVMLHLDSPLALLVLSDRFLARRVPLAADPEAVVSSITADGHFIVGGKEKMSSALHAVRNFRAGDLAWAVQVEPSDGHAFYTRFVRQFDIYLGTIALVMALFVSGGFVIARSVRREVEVARLKADFVSTVSHEFRSPLTGITQLAEMLARDRVPDERKRREYYGLMLREAERLGRLIETVLDFARMEDGRKQYRFESLDAVAWLNSVATEFGEEASRTGYTLEASIAENLPMLSGDREALSTAVRNLLHNAVKYSPHSKTVWLEAKPVGDRLRIAVRDRGVGIAVRHQPRIFEKFYRVDGDLAARVKGVGLGLSLVRHIVDSHRGTVTVDSREGEGSTFVIELMSAT